MMKPKTAIQLEKNNEDIITGTFITLTSLYLRHGLRQVQSPNEKEAYMY